eukprot:492757-Pleurochrysis_carterae.AAC.1
MSQLDARELELGLPSSCSALIDHPSHVRTPGFRGNFAGTRPVSADVIQHYPHLTTKQTVALADAESSLESLRSLNLANAVADPRPRRVAADGPSVRRAINADLADAVPPSAPPSPPAPSPQSSPDTQCTSSGETVAAMRPCVRLATPILYDQHIRVCVGPCHWLTLCE